MNIKQKKLALTKLRSKILAKRREIHNYSDWLDRGISRLKTMEHELKDMIIEAAKYIG